MVFLQSKPLITLATGQTESESNAESLIFLPLPMNRMRARLLGLKMRMGGTVPSQLPGVSSSVLQQKAQPNEGIFEEDCRSLEFFPRFGFV